MSINIAQQLTLETPSFQTKNIHVNIYIFWESDIDPQKLKMLTSIQFDSNQCAGEKVLNLYKYEFIINMKFIFPSQN